MTLRRFLLSLLPRSLREHARVVRGLPAPVRREYLRGVINRRDPDEFALPDGARQDGSILFVCHGNIIRSALAEVLLRQHFASQLRDAPRVRSAGVDATPGNSADPRAIDAARYLGAGLEAHRAQPLSRELVDDAAVIFAMDRVNEAHVGARFPDARGKVRRLGAFALDSRDGDLIPDPFDLDADAVMATAERIHRATAALARHLAADGPAGVPGHSGPSR